MPGFRFLSALLDRKIGENSMKAYWAAGLGAILLFSAVSRLSRADGEPKAADIFAKRIMPIFKSPNPSSCTQCHLSGVDLKNYILPSHEKTFISLRDQGMVNLDKPEESKILRLIGMGEKEKPSLIQEKVRKQEFDAFAEWIKACAADPKLREAPKLSAAELAQPKRPNEVIRYERTDRLLQSFEENIWSQRFRCAHCHMPGERDYAKKAEEYGDKMGWMRPEGAEATMKYLIDKKLVDPKQPTRSSFLLKPLNEVKHGGGQKMRRGDAGYMAFRTWLEDYATVVSDRYAKASDLPKDDVQKTGTEIWLRLTNPPAAWKESVIQMAVHDWDASKKAWSTEPVARTFATVENNQGKVFAHNTLFLLAPKKSEPAGASARAATSLSDGRYLVRIYLAPKAKLEGDFQSVWKTPEFVGQAELPSARWSSGYERCSIFDAGQLGPKK
jgi:hypothetical protein